MLGGAALLQHQPFRPEAPDLAGLTTAPWYSCQLPPCHNPGALMHKIHLLSVPWMLLASHSLLKHFSQMLSQLPGTFSSRLLRNRIVLHRQQLNPCSEPRGQAHLSPRSLCTFRGRERLVVEAQIGGISWCSAEPTELSYLFQVNCSL